MKQYLDAITAATDLSPQESWWLLEHITNKTKQQLMLDNKLSADEIIKLDEAILQISQQHKPLAYLLGWVPFLDLKIQVEAPILIPRHETEEWVADLIKQLQKSEFGTILDIGTGSGCIALALAKNFPNAQITAIDVNEKALDLAKRNAILNNIENINFLQSDLFDQLPTKSKFDLIVSNPPYIDPAEKPTMSDQVTNWEDHTALFAAEQGMAITAQILQKSGDFLNDTTKLPVQIIIEIDRNQKDKAIALANKFGWDGTAHKDSFGKWRTIWCKKR